MHLRQGDYRRATSLPPEMLSRYLPKATHKDRDHEDEDWTGKDRFKHYPYVREVLIWGSGDFVKLFRTNVVDKTPREVTEMERMLRGQAQLPCSFSCGRGHYVCCSHGDVITWGLNDSGQLGHGDKQTRSTPAFVTNLLGSKVFVSYVACGENHTLALSREGHVYSWGSNRCGQLGRSTERGAARSDLPSRITDALADQSVGFIACGVEHSAAITTEGKLFMWGNNGSGQCGVGRSDLTYIYTPTLVSGLGDMGVLYVACGSRHTVALASDLNDAKNVGMVFSVGKNDMGQCGREQGPAELESHSFERVIFAVSAPGENIVQVLCGHDFTILLSDLGNLYGSGSNEHGQLALPEDTKFAPIIRHLDAVNGVSLVSCGADHTVALMEAGLHAWGRGNSGQLGTGELRTSFTPRVIDGFNPPRISSIRASWDHSVVTNCQRSHAIRSIANEFLESEQIYLRNLSLVVNSFLAPLRRKYGALQQLGPQTTLATPSTVNWAVGEHINIIFGNIESLLALSRQFYFTLWFHLQEADFLSSRLAVAATFADIDVVPAYQTYLQLITSGTSVEALQRARLEQDVQVFRECTERFNRERNSTKLASDLEQLLRSPFERIGEYKKLFQRLTKFVPSTHADFEAVVQCYHDMKTLKKKIKVALNEAELTVQFWKKNRSLRLLVSPEKRFIADLSQQCLSIREYPLERYSVILFNTSLCFVAYLEYYNNLGSSNGSHIHFVVDLTAAWLIPNATETELTIQTPEHRYTLVMRDKAAKQSCLELLQNTILALLLQFASNEKLVSKDNVSRRYIQRYKFNQNHPLFADAIFQGEWKDAKMHGQGILVNANGSVYDGQWVDGVQQGEGVWDDKSYRIYYKGSWQNGKLHGVGFMKYRDKGEYFEGEFKESKRNGFGILRAANFKHVGNWKDDKFSGFGLHVYPNGDLYIGLWENGMREKVGWLMHKNGDTYEGEWHLDKMQGRGGYVFATGSRRNEAVFKGWFGPGEGQYPGELTGPGFIMNGNFGYVSDPTKLNFSGQINSTFHKRHRNRHWNSHDGEFVTEGNPGVEVTDGKEWIRFFVDKSFDDEKWNREKATTKVQDIKQKIITTESCWSLITTSFTANSFKQTDHCLFAFVRDFLVIVMEACKAAGLYSLRVKPLGSKHDMAHQYDHNVAKVARPLLAKLVRDVHRFHKHLERGVLDYFGLSGQDEDPKYSQLVSDLDDALYSPVSDLLWPIYCSANADLDSKYEKRLRMLQMMSDDQLFEALETDPRFRLTNSKVVEASSSSPSSTASPTKTSAQTQTPPSAMSTFSSFAGLDMMSPPPTPVSIELPEGIERPTSPTAQDDNLLRTSQQLSPTSSSKVKSPVPVRKTVSPESPTAARLQESTTASLNGSPIISGELLRRLESETVEGVAPTLPAAGADARPYQAAIETLARLAESKTPQQKLVVLRQSFILMNQAITQFWSGRPGAKNLDKYRISSVDEMLPVFIFLVVRASVPRLQSECNFISDFLDEHMSIGEAGMMTQTLAASLQHILTFDWSEFFEIEYKVKPGLTEGNK